MNGEIKFKAFAATEKVLSQRPKMWVLFCIAVGLATFISPNSLQGDTNVPEFAGGQVGKILVYPYRERTVGITIFGQFLPGDEASFKKAVLSTLSSGKLIHAIRIYSPGGDAKVAIDIGAQIRTLQASTYAPFQNSAGIRTCVLDAGVNLKNKWTGGRLGLMHYDPGSGSGDARCMCESACFLAWVGGVGRYGQSVGVHRVALAPNDPGPPYPNYSSQWAKEKYEPVKAVFTDYLARMNVPDAIIARYFATEIQGMHFLSDDELSQLEREPVSLRNLISSKCGPRPAVSNEAAIESWINCGYSVSEARLNDGANAYKARYGN